VPTCFSPFSLSLSRTLHSLLSLSPSENESCYSAYSPVLLVQPVCGHTRLLPSPCSSFRPPLLLPVLVDPSLLSLFLVLVGDAWFGVRFLTEKVPLDVFPASVRVFGVIWC